MKAFKLTTQELTTYNGTKWEIGVAKESSGVGNICSSGWLHFYDCPYLAILLNPVHAKYTNPRLFEAIAERKIKEDNGLKFGCTKLTLVQELGIPEITLNQKVAFGILCTREICKDTQWLLWAENWLSGKDRNQDTAAAADAAAATYAAAAAAAAATIINLKALAQECLKY
jgi:hypothetical protein